MKFLIEVAKVLLKLKLKSATFFHCLRSRIPFNSTWKITGRIIVVRPYFYHPQPKLEIGDHFTAHNTMTSNSCGVIQPTLFNLRSGAELIIGNHVGISGSTISVAESVRIGDHVMIGTGCIITDNDAHSIIAAERIAATGVKHAPVIIGERAFIGARSIILKGVKIGAGAVIAAGSVVVRDVPDNALVAGNPATVRKIIEQ